MASAMNLWSNKRQTDRLLAIARPGSKKLAFIIMKERLRSWRHRKVQLSVSSHCLVQCLTQYCGMSLPEVLCGYSTLLWTCDWRSLKIYLSGPVSADAILSLFVCFIKMWWDSTTPNCYDHGFFIFLLLFCVVLALLLFMCFKLFT